MTTSWREVCEARPRDVDRLRGFRVKAHILEEIEKATILRMASEVYRTREVPCIEIGSAGIGVYRADRSTSMWVDFGQAGD